MEREFGIGRATPDTDSTEELMAEIEAERIQPSPRPKPDRPVLACRQCGQMGQPGDYPFSTCPSSGLCDDCL
jgi:predicted metal-binding protein